MIYNLNSRALYDDEKHILIKEKRYWPIILIFSIIHRFDILLVLLGEEDVKAKISIRLVTSACCYVTPAKTF